MSAPSSGYDTHLFLFIEGIADDDSGIFFIHMDDIPMTFRKSLQHILYDHVGIIDDSLHSLHLLIFCIPVRFP